MFDHPWMAPVVAEAQAQELERQQLALAQAQALALALEQAQPVPFPVVAADPGPAVVGRMFTDGEGGATEEDGSVRMEEA